MITLNVKELKELSKKISTAVDAGDVSKIADYMQLSSLNGVLYMTVTNGRYCVDVALGESPDPNFHAVINATLFLKLIDQTTVDKVELVVTDQYLLFTGNGVYKLPLICDADGNVVELQHIQLENIVQCFQVDSNKLLSILQYNAKQVAIGKILSANQKFYYLDDKGALTATECGACVNNFSLDKPIRLILDEKFVRLFKLLDPDTELTFELSYDALPNGIVQTKVRLKSAEVVISTILFCDDSMLNSYPAQAIRSKVEATYPYAATLNTSLLAGCINRLALFKTSDIVKLSFYADKVVVSDSVNSEEVHYAVTINNLNAPYEAFLKLMDLKSTLAICDDQYITCCFGDDSAITINRNNVVNILQRYTGVES